MVKVTRKGDVVIFDIIGLHKFWSLKSKLEIPFEHIASVTQDVELLEGWKGWRMPGTSIPFILTAGTFYKKGEANFWDVANKDNCIIIRLKDEEFNHLIIEVEDPAVTIALLSEKNEK